MMYKIKMSNINYVPASIPLSSPPPWFLPSLKPPSPSSSFSRPFRLSSSYSTWRLWIIACICAIVNLITLIEAMNYSIQQHTNAQSSATSKSNDLYRISSTASISTATFSAGVSSTLTTNHCHRCNNNNHSLASLVIQEAKPDCISGHYFVSLKNNDRCECELICSRVSGQSCHPYQSTQNLYNLTICDPYLKLFCNEKSKLCQGNLSLVINNIDQDSFTVQWKKQQSNQIINSTTTFKNNTINEIFIALYFPQPSRLQFQKVEARIVEWSNADRYFAKIDRLKTNATYLVKVVYNNQEEYSIVTTKANETSETLPKILVTHRNATSITIVFDDFKPLSTTTIANNDSDGYEIHYRPNNGFFHQYNQWLIIKSNGTPLYTLTGLKPNTVYKIQVFTWSHIDHRQVLSSEIIEASTSNGCLYRNSSYELNEKILEDCEQSCLCDTNGNVICRKRCIAPYMSIKEAQQKNLKCTFPANDQCCVQCISPSSVTLLSASSLVPVNVNETEIEVLNLDFSTYKSGTCPSVFLPFEQNGYNNFTKRNKNCTNDCQHDYQCPTGKKCCRNQCGTFSCQQPIELNMNISHQHHFGDDCPLKCDADAECRFIAEESAFRCICLDKNDGQIDLKKNSCHRMLSNERKHLCVFQNRTLFISQTFEHDCHICVCTEALEIDCRPKCKNPVLVSDNCRVVEDPYDPVCCRKQVCDLLEPENQTSTAIIETIGCKHLNRTYSINEVFFIDCELKCLCKSSGEVQCSPRCNDEENSYNENYCQWKPDPDDPQCCRISVCSINSTLIQNKILIEMAESINSTAIKFKLLQFNQPYIQNINVFYRKFSPPLANGTTEIETPETQWKNQSVSVSMLLFVTNDSKEIVLGNLEPETDYEVYFISTVDNEVSNTVVVRTFPPGIDYTFKGCFYGSQIIQIGEVFYDGDCEYKCVCKEGGIRDCIDRCPVFVDLVHPERCQFVPSPEDPCCTIPVCDNNLALDSSLMPKCVWNNERYNIGETWTFGASCEEKTCTCVMNSTNFPEVKCKDGCPEIPASVLKPTVDCPQPQLIQTNDPCTCPYVVCANNINPLDLPEKSTQFASKSFKNYCEFKGSKIKIGEEFYDGCRAICTCNGAKSNLDCRPIQCNHNFGPHTTKCLEWEIDPLFVPKPPNCCPEPKCKNDGSCSFAGIRFSNYKLIPPELLPCHKRCMCNNGQVNCKNICPEISDEPPLNLPCPPSLAFRGHLSGEDCCIHWQCRENYRDKIYGKCSYKDKVYKLGEYWEDSETEIHRRCQCKITNGILHVICEPGACQPITERFLEPTAECKVPTVVTPKDAIMCPYVICNNTATDGEIDNIEIVAINSTSTRIRFTIPSIYTGLLGHAEVHYVTDINIPRSKWNIQKFARPKRLFDIPNIEYHLGNLHPDTTYFLQIVVIIEALKSGPISEIYKIYMPPLPALMTSTSSTTTTTSTLPPVIMLDMHLNALTITADSVTIGWRSFTAQEKKFIDGIQVRYRITVRNAQEINDRISMTNDNDGKWIYSQLLHRDITNYQLDKLETGQSYLIDLVFISIDQISANIISSKPIIVDIPRPAAIVDNYRFDFHLYPEDVTMDDQGRISIELKQVPKPINKYVNVAKVRYQDTKTLESFYDYVNIDDNTMGKILLTNLMPNTRYKLWIDLYLTNGQIVSSNSIDLITNIDKRHYFKMKNDLTNGASLVTDKSSATMPAPKYYFGMAILSIIMFLTGFIFLIITCICLRRQSSSSSSSSAASSVAVGCGETIKTNKIVANISEAAYDNPTYKTFEKCTDNCNVRSSNNTSITVPSSKDESLTKMIEKSLNGGASLIG